jgi:anti-sigma B factor antagonist
MREIGMAEFFTTEKNQDICIIRFCFNEINLEQREELKKGLQGILQTGTTKFIIDLSKVGFVSSLVIATIVFFSKGASALGGQIKICGLSSDAFSVFQLTQLDKIFELYRAEGDALESFNK